MRKDCVSLWKFKQILNRAWRNRGNAVGMKVIFDLDGEEVYLDSIGQFQIVPDVTIHLNKVKKDR